MKLLLSLIFLAFLCEQCLAIDVRFHCGTAIVTGDPNEVTEFGMEYLHRLNPRIMDTKSGRTSVAAVVRCGAKGRLDLVAKGKPYLDVLWGMMRDHAANVTK